MKKIILMAALAAATSQAMATTACSGGTGIAITGVSDGTAFVKVTFTPQCSANVFVDFGQNQVSLWGGSGSAKGKNTFKGSTNGGAVSVSAACDPTGCTLDKAVAATGAAAPAGGGGSGT